MEKSSLLKTIHLHGPFAYYHDGPIEVMGDTIAEIVEAVTRQVKGFDPDPINGRKRISVVGYDTEESLYQDVSENELHIVPQMIGSKDNAVLTQIVLGSVLVGVGLAMGTTGPGALLGSIAIKIGALMILGGLSQMLSPQPEADKSSDVSRTRYLGTPKNTVQIGTRIPILYGEDRVYGHYLSFDINAREFKGVATESTSGGK